jgi:alpha-tubulin suppressor-like RCC1 family protein
MPYKINALTAGKSQTLALLASGEVLGWGGAGSGRYTPDNTDICSTRNTKQEPIYVGQAVRFSKVSAGYGVSLGVSDRQELLIWGFSSMGTGKGQAVSEIPTVIEQISSPIHVTAGQSCFAAIDQAYALHTWGLNIDGVLGRNTAQINALPGTVDGLPLAQAVGLGDNFMIVLSRDGEVFSFGSNSAGQLGLGHLKNISTPRPVKLPRSVHNLAVGATHVLTLDIDGNIMAWGSNQYGQLGNGQSRYSETPVSIKVPEKITAIAAGSHFSLALSETGSVYTWGWNGFGQLGLNDLAPRTTPTRIPELSDVQVIAAGEMHALAIGKNYLYGWGNNESGQIGQAGQKQRVPFPSWPVG